MTRPGGLAWFGATLVWVMAAVMSFAGLRDLADTCGISHTISWLLPLVIDMGVLVAAWVWRRGVNPAASKLAGRLTWSLLCLTVAGNATELGMRASQVNPPWWVAALVGAIPPAVAGAVAHLLVLLARTVDVGLLDTSGHDVGKESNTARRDKLPDFIPADIPATPPAPAKPKPKPVRVPQASDKKSTRKGQGRRALAAELGISDYAARKLLEQREAEQAPRNGHRVLTEAK
jgi:hypothetical protein